MINFIQFREAVNINGSEASPSYSPGRFTKTTLVEDGMWFTFTTLTARGTTRVIAVPVTNIAYVEREDRPPPPTPMDPSHDMGRKRAA